MRDVGYTALTIEAVAKRAGTSKPVIYRRWPNRAHLVIAAWASQRPIEHRTPDTGTLRADMLRLFTKINQRVGAMMSETIAGVVAEAFKHPEVASLLRERLDSAPLNRSVERIIEQAVARGELPAINPPDRVLRLPLDLIRAEAVMCGSPIDDDVIADMVDSVYLPLLRGLALDQDTSDPRPH